MILVGSYRTVVQILAARIPSLAQETERIATNLAPQPSSRLDACLLKLVSGVSRSAVLLGFGL